MRERKLEIVFLGVRTIISIILITMISFVIMSLVKDIPGRTKIWRSNACVL